MRLLLVLVAVTAATAASVKAPVEATKFQQEVWKLMQLMGTDPVDPNELTKDAPKLMAMLKKTQGGIDSAIKDTEELTKNIDGDKASAVLDKLDKDVSVASQAEMNLLSDVLKFLLKSVFNGMKGGDDCGSLGKLIAKHKGGKGDKGGKREVTEEEGKKMAKAGLADLKCAKGKLDKMEKFSNAISKEGAIKSGEDFEHAMGKALVHMGRVWRSVSKVLKGMHETRAYVISQAERKRTVESELDKLLALLD